MIKTNKLGRLLSCKDITVRLGLAGFRLFWRVLGRFVGLDCYDCSGVFVEAWTGVGSMEK